MKKMVLGSMGAAGLVALLAILDLALGIPFKRLVMMDVLFLISASMVLYMGYDSLRDLR